MYTEEEIDSFYETLGMVIRKLRLEAGMTEHQLGILCGYSKAGISLIELGQTRVPLDMLLCICYALDVDVLNVLAFLKM